MRQSGDNDVQNEEDPYNSETEDEEDEDPSGLEKGCECCGEELQQSRNTFCNTCLEEDACPHCAWLLPDPSVCPQCGIIMSISANYMFCPSCQKVTAKNMEPEDKTSLVAERGDPDEDEVIFP